MNELCECSDPGCPACHGHCDQMATDVVYRVDMEDETGTPMCGACAEDCLECGLFQVEEIDEDDAEGNTDAS